MVVVLFRVFLLSLLVIFLGSAIAVPFPQGGGGGGEGGDGGQNGQGGDDSPQCAVDKDDFIISGRGYFLKRHQQSGPGNEDPDGSCHGQIPF